MYDILHRALVYAQELDLPSVRTPTHGVPNSKVDTDETRVSKTERCAIMSQVCNKKIMQCTKCPWKKSTNPLEIPGGYDEGKHKSLTSTIVGEGRFRPVEVQMACHESNPLDPFVCAGWLDNQLGVGNNLGLRLAAMRGQVPQYHVEGEQHERLEDTFPTKAQRAAYNKKTKLNKRKRVKLFEDL